MAEKTSRDLVMSFDRADGKNHNITIPDYREDITDAEVKTGGASHCERWNLRARWLCPDRLDWRCKSCDH